MQTHAPLEIVTIGGGMTASILAAETPPHTHRRMVAIEQGPARWTSPDFANRPSAPIPPEPPAHWHMVPLKLSEAADSMPQKHCWLDTHDGKGRTPHATTTDAI